MKVAIIGKAPSSRLLAPFDDPEFQIWSLSDNHTVLPRWDRWFELHDLDRYKKDYGVYYDWLCAQPAAEKPIYVAQARDEIPAGVPYPKDYIVGKYGRYFTNSISWMAALAIDEMSKDNSGGHEMHFYGVDMAQNTEYSHQRPSCEYFLGVAHGLGIKIHVPGESDLLKCARLYAFDTNRGELDAKLRARARELQQRQAGHEQEVEQAMRGEFVCAGGIQMLQEVGKLNGQLTPEWLKEKHGQLQKEMGQASQVKADAQKKVFMLMGARENIEWSKQWA